MDENLIKNREKNLVEKKSKNKFDSKFKIIKYKTIYDT